MPDNRAQVIQSAQSRARQWAAFYPQPCGRCEHIEAKHMHLTDKGRARSGRCRVVGCVCRGFLRAQPDFAQAEARVIERLGATPEDFTARLTPNERREIYWALRYCAARFDDDHLSELADRFFTEPGDDADHGDDLAAKWGVRL